MCATRMGRGRGSGGGYGLLKENHKRGINTKATQFTASNHICGISVTCCAYLCSKMVYDHLECGQQDDLARNIARLGDDSQAGSWNVDAFLRK